ncbi:MAG: FecR domain-containing protein [Bacteroidetes bacterium]|nr:FecR domain-containing protein [Bacteroidota bacterium]
MDSQSTHTYDDLPWQLIVPALQGELSPEESGRFEEWLAASPANRATYQRLLDIWQEGIADYTIYEKADEKEGWEALRGRLDEGRIVAGNFRRRSTLARRLAVAAALVLVAGGAAFWYLSGKGEALRYETAMGEQRTVALPDGSTIVLQQQTRLRLADDYNKNTRTIVLLGGEASFDVSHQQQLPFVVDMDAASIKDIGTSFTIAKTTDSIKVTVSSGKIAFTKKETGETRELTAGGSICLYTSAARHGEITATDPLRFDNAPLSKVVAALEKQFGKKIQLGDPALAQKRLTVHLDGESLEDAIKTVCASLQLDYDAVETGYILKKKDDKIK